MQSEIVLLTGATDGIGLATARALLKQKIELILHGRSLEKLEKTKQQLLKEIPSARIPFLAAADLASQVSVQNMCRLVKENFTYVNALILNAGVFCQKRELSEDGFELTFAVNHLAHFQIAMSLRALFNQPVFKLVSVSSIAHKNGKLVKPAPLNDLNFWDEQLNFSGRAFEFNPYHAYANSKLLNVLFAFKWARENPTHLANALHPGVVTTKLLKKGFNTTGISTEAGAATTLYVYNQVKSTGHYYSDQKQEKVNPLALDEELQDAVWNYSLAKVQSYLE